MKRHIFLAAVVTATAGYAHVWDELAILARPTGDGTFDLEKYTFLQASAYTNGVFFDYNNVTHRLSEYTATHRKLPELRETLLPMHRKQ